MLNPLQKAKDLNDMRKQAQQLQRELDEEMIEIVKGNIKVIMSASQKVKTIEIDGQENSALIGALQEAINKAQQVAAGKLQSMSGGLSGLLK